MLARKRPQRTKQLLRVYIDKMTNFILIFSIFIWLLRDFCEKVAANKIASKSLPSKNISENCGVEVQLRFVFSRVWIMFFRSNLKIDVCWNRLRRRTDFRINLWSFFYSTNLLQ